MYLMYLIIKAQPTEFLSYLPFSLKLATVINISYSFSSFLSSSIDFKNLYQLFSLVCHIIKVFLNFLLHNHFSL